MSTYVVNLFDYTPPQRFPPIVTPWTTAQISYSPDNIVAYTVLVNVTLTPSDTNPEAPISRNFTVTTAPTATGWLQVTFLDGLGNQAPTAAVQYPPTTGQGTSNPTLLSARYAVRHRIRDGVPLLDANPVPFNMVRLEDLSDQVPIVATPVQTVFQCRYQDVPTQRYMNAQVVPGTLVAYLDGSWTPTVPSQDVDINGNFTLPTVPVAKLLITYAWQYLSDGEIDQAVDEARQWLREFNSVTTIPDGLVPALVSYASFRALTALQRSANLAPVHAGDSEIDWSQLAKTYQMEATSAYNTACSERTAYYTQGPEALDPTVTDASSIYFPQGPFTPLR